MSNANGFHRRLAAVALIAALASALSPMALFAEVTRVDEERMARDFVEAGRLRAEGKPDEAVKLLEGTLARIKAITKPGDRHIGMVMNLLGVEYFHANRYEDAERMFRESIAIGQALPGLMG